MNPDVDPQTHKYISTGKKENKFGLDLSRAEQAYELAAKLPGLEIVGLHMHIGSQILSSAPYARALHKVEMLCRELKAKYPGFNTIDIGGGLGISYRPLQDPLDPRHFAEVVAPFLRRLNLNVVMEPGRFLVGNAGILVTRIQYIKDGPSKKFVDRGCRYERPDPSLALPGASRSDPRRENTRIVYGGCGWPDLRVRRFLRARSADAESESRRPFWPF